MEASYRNEIWHPVVGWEGLYEVSNFGRVRSLPRVIHKSDGNIYTCKGRILGQFKSHGYFEVRLRYKAGGCIKYVHRLVAESFVENPNNYNVINHKDENITNNNSDNLEWCTNTYNLHYGNACKKAHKVIKMIRKRYNLQHPRAIGVELYDLDGNLKESFLSITDAATLLGLKSASNIRTMLRRHKIYKGYIWKFTKNKYENGKFSIKKQKWLLD